MHQSLSDSNNLADFSNVSKELLPKNPPENPSKRSSKKIPPKNIQEESKKIQKVFNNFSKSS